MRDALSLFDQMSSFTQGNLTYEKVIESLNILDYDCYFRFTEQILAAETAQLLFISNFKTFWLKFIFITLTDYICKQMRCQPKTCFEVTVAYKY